MGIAAELEISAADQGLQADIVVIPYGP